MLFRRWSAPLGVLVGGRYIGLMRIVVGILISVLGFLLIIYREKAQMVTGTIGFAERYFGGGGTFTFLAILGLLFFIGGLMWAAGTFQSLFQGILGPFF